jgi:hypothetical protein
VGIFTNRRRYSPVNFARVAALTLKNNDNCQLARPLHCYWHGPDGRVQAMTRGLKMFATFNSARETCTILAGALISALLLVSAATSLPIA